MQQPVPHLIPVLKANAAFIPTDRQSFVASLVGQFTIKGALSEKQWYWVAKIADDLTNPVAKVAAPKPTVGDFAPVIAIFEKAKGKLQAPKIALACGLPGKVELALTDPLTSKYPGEVNIVRKISGSKEWLGRVTKAGEVVFSKQANDAIRAELLASLKTFAADPTGAAKSYGKLTAHCCFCKKGLTTKESLSAGYGPDCAEHYGLPWGFKAEAA